MFKPHVPDEKQFFFLNILRHDMNYEVCQILEKFSFLLYK